MLNEKLRQSKEQSKRDFFTESADYLLQSFKANLWKTAILFVIAFVLGILKPVVLAFMVVFLLGSHAFSVYFENSLVCLVVGLASYVILSLVNNKISLPIPIVILAFLRVGLTLYLYAPVSTGKRPIIKEEIGLHRKVLSETTSIVFLSAVLLPTFRLVIIFSSVLTAFWTTPIATKLVLLVDSKTAVKSKEIKKIHKNRFNKLYQFMNKHEKLITISTFHFTLMSTRCVVPAWWGGESEIPQSLQDERKNIFKRL